MIIENIEVAGQNPEGMAHKARYTRFAQYRRTDILLTQKYGMSFDEFVKQRVVCDHGYSWESESDAMNWEMAISGMNTIDKHLNYPRKDKSAKGRR